ncbi:sigma-70 family RNA polymerase sigma factor [Chitinimonas sp. BJB300]|uniref:sigma-70 family RNA polymerase sigma factor n=1 Tax=Chitinimonas sp. BJB300 TaxID=1559339 RepID=UPI000C0C94E1|nr:sigma-70 family RNA polymerase sigma factor [Chitinimonas sp. BJB300]PHV12864.1 flagellar biosynthesis protein FliA [Chitinimonas sp. BJB300]TSJ86104.1 sigma-70 family RNA polymerase sigma factor [Chitinimonas sp. BJB300]
MSQSKAYAWQKLDPSEEAGLWAKRAQTGSKARCRLAELYLPFARMVAAKLYGKRPNDEIEFGDYMQLASVGLLDAIDRFDASQGTAFTTYAHYRIQGSVLNELEHYTERQKQHGLQRRIKERIKSMDNTAMSTDPDKVFERLAAVAIGMAIGMMLEDEGLCLNEEPDAVIAPAYTSLELRQLSRQLSEMIECLPERHAQVIRYHYLQQLDFSEIAKLLGISKGRISQLHQAALAKLRSEIAQLNQGNLAW